MNGISKTLGGKSQNKTTKAAGKGEPVDGPSDGTNAEALDIEGNLNALRESLKQARENRGNADGNFVDLEARLNVLEGVEQDYPTTKKAYDAAYPQLLRESDNITDYLDSEESKLKTRLGTKAAEDVEGRVTALQTKTDDLKVAVEEAQRPETGIPLEFLQQAIKDRTAELNTWKSLTATVTAQHAELKKLREDITKARQEGHYGLAYGLVLLAKKKHEADIDGKGPGLVPPAKLHEEFHSAGKALADAQTELATAERQLETKKGILTVAIRALEDHQKSAEAKLRVDLVDVAPAGTLATLDEDPATTTGGQATRGSTPGARRPSTGDGTPSTAAVVSSPARAGGAAAADIENQGTTMTEKTEES